MRRTQRVGYRWSGWTLPWRRHGGARAAITFGLRALPFLAAKFPKKNPLVQQMGHFLPLAIMTLLLLQTFVGSARQNPSGPWAELAAVTIPMSIGCQWPQTPTWQGCPGLSQR